MGRASYERMNGEEKAEDVTLIHHYKEAAMGKEAWIEVDHPSPTRSDT